MNSSMPGDRHCNLLCLRVFAQPTFHKGLSSYTHTICAVPFTAILGGGTGLPSTSLVSHTGPVQSPFYLQLPMRGGLQPSSLGVQAWLERSPGTPLRPPCRCWVPIAHERHMCTVQRDRLWAGTSYSERGHWGLVRGPEFSHAQEPLLFIPEP